MKFKIKDIYFFLFAFVFIFLITLIANYLLLTNVILLNLILASFISAFICNLLFFCIYLVLIKSNIIYLFENLKKINSNPLHTLNVSEYNIFFRDIATEISILKDKNVTIISNIINFQDIISNIEIKLKQLFDEYIMVSQRLNKFSETLKNNDFNIGSMLSKDEIQLNKNLEKIEIAKESTGKNIQDSNDISVIANSIKLKINNLLDLKNTISEIKSKINDTLKSEESLILKSLKGIDAASSICQQLDILTVNMGIEISKIESKNPEIITLSEEIKKLINELLNNVNDIKNISINMKTEYLNIFNNTSSFSEIESKITANAENILATLNSLEDKDKSLINKLNENYENIDVVLLNMLSLSNEKNYQKQELNSYMQNFNSIIKENKNQEQIFVNFNKLLNRLIIETKKITAIESNYANLNEIQFGIRQEIQIIIDKLKAIISKAK